MGVWLDLSLRLQMLSNLLASMSFSASNSLVNRHLWFCSRMYSQLRYFSECSESLVESLADPLVMSLVLQLDDDLRLESSSLQRLERHKQLNQNSCHNFLAEKQNI